MQADVRFDSAASIVVLADEAVGAEVPTRDVAETESLRGRAQAGGAFLIEGDDPWLAKLQIYVDQPVPEEIEAACTARSGSFLLRVPSGRLSVCALGTGSPQTGEPPEVRTLDVPPGDYALSLLDGSVPDVPALMARQQAQASPADWRLFERVNHFGAFGCLAIALGMLFVVVPYTRREYWFLLPLFLLPTCAYTLLRHLHGYARVAEQCRKQEADLPQIAISLRRVESTEGLEGGGYRCQ